MIAKINMINLPNIVSHRVPNIVADMNTLVIALRIDSYTRWVRVSTAIFSYLMVLDLIICSKDSQMRPIIRRISSFNDQEVGIYLTLQYGLGFDTFPGYMGYSPSPGYERPDPVGTLCYLFCVVYVFELNKI